MSTNQRFLRGQHLRLPVPSGALSGTPTVSGQIPVVCETDRDAQGYASCNLEGAFAILVGGIDAGGGSAVQPGDKLFFTSGDTPQINKKATGVFWGYAVSADPPTPPGTAAPVSLVAASATTTTIIAKVGA